MYSIVERHGELGLACGKYHTGTTLERTPASASSNTRKRDKQHCLDSNFQSFKKTKQTLSYTSVHRETEAQDFNNTLRTGTLVREPSFCSWLLTWRLVCYSWAPTMSQSHVGTRDTGHYSPVLMPLTLLNMGPNHQRTHGSPYTHLVLFVYKQHTYKYFLPPKKTWRKAALKLSLIINLSTWFNVPPQCSK